MTRWVMAFLPLALGIFAYAQPTPTPFDVSKIDFSKISEEDIRKTEEHRAQLKGQLKNTLDSQEATVKDQSKTIDDLKGTIEQTKKSFEDYQSAAEIQIANGNKAIVAAAHLTKLLHRAKWIMSGLWIALCAFIALKLQKVPMVGQYALWGVLALGAAGVTFIWAWL